MYSLLFEGAHSHQLADQSFHEFPPTVVQYSTTTTTNNNKQQQTTTKIKMTKNEEM